MVGPGAFFADYSQVIGRDNQRRKTFTSDSDYQVYIERLARYDFLKSRSGKVLMRRV
jgi:hypothetical protein